MVNDPTAVFMQIRKLADEVSQRTETMGALFHHGHLDHPAVEEVEHICLHLLAKVRSCYCLASTK